MPNWLEFIIIALVVSFALFLILSMMLIIVHWRDEIRKKRDEAKTELAKIIVEKSQHQKHISKLRNKITQLEIQINQLKAAAKSDDTDDAEEDDE